jgi:hypothetical protein
VFTAVQTKLLVGTDIGNPTLQLFLLTEFLPAQQLFSTWNVVSNLRVVRRAWCRVLANTKVILLVKFDKLIKIDLGYSAR